MKKRSSPKGWGVIPMKSFPNRDEPQDYPGGATTGQGRVKASRKRASLRGRDGRHAGMFPQNGQERTVARAIRNKSGQARHRDGIR